MVLYHHCMALKLKKDSILYLVVAFLFAISCVLIFFLLRESSRPHIYLHSLVSTNGKIRISLPKSLVVADYTISAAEISMNPAITENAFVAYAGQKMTDGNINNTMWIDFFDTYPFDTVYTNPCVLLNYGSTGTDILPGATPIVVNGFDGCEEVDSSGAEYAVTGHGAAVRFEITIKDDTTKAKALSDFFSVVQSVRFERGLF